MTLFYSKSLRIVSFWIVLFGLLTTMAYADPLKQFEENTEAILHMANMLQQGKMLDATQLLKLKTLSLERQKMLSSKKEHLQNYYNYLLPEEVLTKLPREVQALIEKEIKNLEGKLEIRYVDVFGDFKSKNAHNVLRYVLYSKDGKIYYLNFTNIGNLSLQTGDVIRLDKAYFLPNIRNSITTVVVHPDAIHVLHKVAKSAIPTSFGPQTTVVILANFQDDPGNKPWTTDAVKQVMFTDVNKMFYEFSYGQATVVGDVINRWFTLPLNSNGDCDRTVEDIGRLATDAATKAGYDLSKYKIHVFLFPRLSSCWWGGMASVGPGYNRTWLNGANDKNTAGHELGHNVGLAHSRSLSCDLSPNTGRCTREEYGDFADTMGYGGPAHYNAYHKDRLGWLNYKTSPPITTVNASGDYAIDVYETISTKPKALKILKSQTTKYQDYYYVEFRQPIGFDSQLNCSTCDFTKGVILHQPDALIPEHSNILDMSYLDKRNNKQVALLPGQTFTDRSAPNNGVSITLKSITTTGANVNVTFGSTPPPPPPQGCVRANPTLTINPSTTQWLPAGSSANWTITIKNNDSSVCTSSRFTFQVTQPPVCMRYKLSAPSVTLAPGTSANVNLFAVTASWIESKVYTLNILATNTAASTYTGQVNALLGIMTNIDVENPFCAL